MLKPTLRSKTKFIALPPPYSLAIALAGGILMGLTPAPFNAWWLAWVALAPLWAIVRMQAEPTHPEATVWRKSDAASLALHALLWGIGYHGLALFWITGVHPLTWMGVPWLASLAIALFCWLFITLWGAMLVVVWSVLVGWLFQRRQGVRSHRHTAEGARSPVILSLLTRLLIGIALWCGLETLWGYAPLYWSSISYTQSPHNLVILHLGQLSGPMTVTAAIVAVNALLAEAWVQFRVEQTQLSAKKLAIGGVSLLVVLHLVGLVLYSRPIATPPEAALRIGIIQGNIPNTIKLYEEGIRRALDGYTNGYRQLAREGVDAVLTPEGALPLFQREVMQSAFVAAVREEGVVAWLGAFGDRERGYGNSLFTILGTGNIFSRYDKVNMVPIGEYVPFEPYIGGLVQRLSPLNEHQVAGPDNQLFHTPFGKAIVGICYDSAFPNHFRYQAAAGGQFILTASNNAHFSPAMPAQHHAQDVMRAIETDRWAARATNTGYSAFVDPHGKTLWFSGINTYERHAETIYRRQTQTPYVRWGDWLTPLLLIGAIATWGRDRLR